MNAETQQGEQVNVPHLTERAKKLADASQLAEDKLLEVKLHHPDWPPSRIRSVAMEQVRKELPEGLEIKSRRERRLAGRHNR